jgi:hypothetical protein
MPWPLNSFYRPAFVLQNQEICRTDATPTYIGSEQEAPQGRPGTVVGTRCPNHARVVCVCAVAPNMLLLALLTVALCPLVIGITYIRRTIKREEHGK